MGRIFDRVTRMGSQFSDFWGGNSLRKRPFLLSLRRWGHLKSEERRMYSQARVGGQFFIFTANKRTIMFVL